MSVIARFSYERFDNLLTLHGQSIVMELRATLNRYENNL